MKWWLVIVLMTGQGNEVHVAMQVPSEEACKRIGTTMMYAQEFQGEQGTAREIVDTVCEVTYE